MWLLAAGLFHLVSGVWQIVLGLLHLAAFIALGLWRAAVFLSYAIASLWRWLVLEKGGLSSVK
jgi:hypothetical protein